MFGMWLSEIIWCRMFTSHVFLPYPRYIFEFDAFASSWIVTYSILVCVFFIIYGRGRISFFVSFLFLGRTVLFLHDCLTEK